MTVGVCRIRLRLAENHSLKGKRQVVKSIISQVSNRFNVSVAEVEDQDLWQIATIAVACVSNDASVVNEVMSRVVNFISQGRWDVELLDYETELLPIS